MKTRVLVKLIVQRYGLWIAAFFIVLITIWVVRARKADQLDWQFVRDGSGRRSASVRVYQGD
jgi:lysozyme